MLGPAKIIETNHTGSAFSESSTAEADPLHCFCARRQFIVRTRPSYDGEKGICGEHDDVAEYGDGGGS